MSGKIKSGKGRIFMTTSVDDQVRKIMAEAEKEKQLQL